MVAHLAKNIASLDPLELEDLKKHLKEAYGILLDTNERYEEEVKPRYIKDKKIVVTEVNNEFKIHTIKIIREVSLMGLRESVDFFESIKKFPETLKENISQDEAESIKRKLAEVGSSVIITGV